MRRRARPKRGVTFDTGALIALERRKASALALLRVCRQARVAITIPAAVVVEWWRGTHAALLESAYLEPLSPALAKAAGELLARARRSDAVDATVIVSAAQRGDIVATDDPADLIALSSHVRGVDVMEI
jgi:hypothetical protein